MALIDDLDPDKAYGGMEGLWVLPKNHPFNKHFQMHDLGWDQARTGDIVGENSDGIDGALLRGMLEVAGHDKSLRLQAFFFFEICQVYGKWAWPDAAKEEYQKLMAAVRRRNKNGKKRLRSTKRRVCRSKKVSRKNVNRRGRPVGRRKGNGDRSKSKRVAMGSSGRLDRKRRTR